MLVINSPTIQMSKQDAWISHLIATVISLFIVWLAVKIGEADAKSTFLQLSKKLFGNWFGTVIVIVFLLVWISVIPIILIEISNFINTILLPKTNPIIFYISLLLLLIYLTYNGAFQSLGRLSEVFGPIILFSMVLMLLLLIKEYDFKNILPIVADNSFYSIIKGSFIPLSLLGESIILIMLVHFSEDSKKVLKNAIGGVLLSSFLSGAVLLSILLTFGVEISMEMIFSAFNVISYISVLNFIQNLELLAVLVTFLSIFIKLSLYFLLLCHTTAQMVNVKNWKLLSFFYAVPFLLTNFTIPNVSYALKYFDEFWVKYVLPIYMIAIPIVYYIVIMIRKRFFPFN